jgi:branched-chain amino acid transport system permease protein
MNTNNIKRTKLTIPHKTSKETWIVIAVVLVIMILIPIPFRRNRYIINILVSFCYFAIMSSSLNLVNGYSGQMNLGPGAFMAIGGYTYAILQKTVGLPIPLALFLAIFHSFLWGLVLGLACCKLTAIFLGIASLGFSTALTLFITNEGWLTGGANGFSQINRLVFFGHKLNNFETYYVALAVAVLILIFCYRLVYSKTGRALQAIRSSPVAAAACGIDVNKYKLMICGISAGMGGVSGCIYAVNLTYLSADVFNADNVMYLTMNAVGGGMGNLIGPIIGTFVIGPLRELLRPSANHLQGVYGVVLVLIMRFMPFGIYGAFRQVRGKILAKMAERKTGLGIADIK